MTDTNVTTAPAFSWWGRLRQIARVVRLRPYDQSTPEGRSAERHRRLAISGMAAIFAKGLNVIVMFISVRLTLHYLGDERYGLWTAISSLVAMLSFADLGMGNGLLTAVAESHGRDDRDGAARQVSSAFFMLLTIALILGLVFAVAYPFVPWSRVVNAKTALAAVESPISIAVFLLFFLLNLPLGVVDRVQAGYQQGFTSSLWASLGTILTLLGVILCAKTNAGLPWLIVAMSGAPTLVILINGIICFGWQRRWLLPKLSLVNLASARAMLNIGLLYLILQICVSMAFFADNVVVAQVLGLENVPEYSLPMRLFGIPSLIITLVSTALWPAYGEALARRDIAWIRRTLVRSLKLTLAVTVPCVLLLMALHGPILHLWVGDSVHPTWGLIIGLGIWTVMGSLGSAVAMFYNALRIVGYQVVTSLAMAGTNLVLSIMLARWIGVAGVIWGTVISYAIFVALPAVFFIPATLRRLQRESHQPPTTTPSSA